MTTTTQIDPRPGRGEVLRLTYGSLRWLLVLLPLVLFVVTVATAIYQGHLETSISAYYGGPVRDIFVGVLIAVAACLVAYQGSTTLEDYNLNGAGFYAAFVALVPTGLGRTLDDLREASVLSPGGMTPAEFVWSLRISLSVVVVLALVLLVHELRSSTRVRDLVSGDPITLGFVMVTGATLLAFLGLAMWQLWVPPAAEVTLGGIVLPVLDVRLRIHDLAAIFLISALAVAVWGHAWPRVAAQRSQQRLEPRALATQGRYRVIFLLMLAGPVVAWALAAVFAPGHLVIFLEWWEIALFCVFWSMETWRLREDDTAAA